MSDNTTKAKYWTAILYPEHLIDDWEECISSVLQMPYAYCIHNKDIDAESKERKDHVHLIIAFNNTTTYKNAKNVISGLYKPGHVLNIIKRVIGIRYMYDYLIHDTDDCKKKNKYLYPECARITGNGFDIGLLEQISLADKFEIMKNIRQAIKEYKIFNFYDLDLYVSEYMDASAYEVFTGHQGYFANLVRGYYNKVRSGMTNENAIMKKYLETDEKAYETHKKNL